MGRDSQREGEEGDGARKDGGKKQGRKREAKTEEDEERARDRLSRDSVDTASAGYICVHRRMYAAAHMCALVLGLVLFYGEIILGEK